MPDFNSLASMTKYSKSKIEKITRAQEYDKCWVPVTGF